MGLGKRLLVALAVALLAGSLGWWLAGSSPVGTPPPAPQSDRIDEAVAALQQDSFHVAPELRHVLTDEQRAAISAELDTAEVPTYLLFMADTTDGGYYISAYLLDHLSVRLGDGLYAVVDETMEGTARDYGVNMSYVSGDILKARPAQGLLQYAGALAAADRYEDRGEHDYWGGRWGGIAAGALLAFLISLGPGLFVLIARGVSKK